MRNKKRLIAITMVLLVGVFVYVLTRGHDLNIQSPMIIHYGSESFVDHLFEEDVDILEHDVDVYQLSDSGSVGSVKYQYKGRTYEDTFEYEVILVMKQGVFLNYEDTLDTAFLINLFVEGETEGLDLVSHTVDLSHLGDNSATLTFKSKEGTSKYSVGYTLIDTTQPVFVLDSDVIEIEVGETLQLSEYVHVKDGFEGELGFEVEGTFDTDKVGTYSITIKAVDSSGNEAIKAVEVIVKKKPVVVTSNNVANQPVKKETAKAAEKVEPVVSHSACDLAGVIRITNEQRSKVGVASLKNHTKLAEVAQIKAQDMVKNKYFSHTSPTYGSPYDMMKSFGISYWDAGENIASGYDTAESVMKGWMDSSGHRDNILNASYTHIGVGCENGIWVQMFIKSR